MRTIIYGAQSFDLEAFQAIETYEPFVLMVPAKSASQLRHALELRALYFSQGSPQRGSIWAWIRFGWCALRTPTFWAILNKAELRGIPIRLLDHGTDLHLHFE